MRSSIQFNNPHDAENIKTKYPESISYLNPDRNNEIWISWGKWNKLKMDEIFPKIKSLDINGGLWLRRNNNQPLIIQKIHHITLENLQSLGLTKNNIESGELLCRINMPNLKLLRLDQNKIINIGSFKKLQVPFLNRISFDNNLIISGWECLAAFDSLSLEWIDIEGFPDDQYQMFSPQYLLKIKTKKLIKLLMRSRERIQPSEAVIEAIGQKNKMMRQIFLKP